MTRQPLPSTGSLGRFPRFPGTMGCSDFSTPFPRPPVSLGGRYHRSRFVRSAPSHREGSAWPGPIHRWAHAVFSGGDVEISQVPGEPPVDVPRSRTPAGPSPPGQSRRRGRGLPLTERRRHPRTTEFRGSMTRPAHSLSTLHPRGRPRRRKTRFWLPGQLCQAGWLAPHRAPMHGFGLYTSSVPRLRLAHSAPLRENTKVRGCPRLCARTKAQTAAAPCARGAVLAPFPPCEPQA